MPTHDFIDAGDILNFDIIRGTVVTIDSTTDTCTVTVGGDTLTALLCYHCEPDSIARDSGAIEGAASGFEVGDEVIVLKRKDNGVIKVIGHTNGIRRCTKPITVNDYYVFYLDGSVLKIANCTYGDEGFEVIDTRNYTEVLTNNTSYPVTFHCKRFSHNVPTNGEIVTRDLYFITTSLYINPNPYTGWVNFATANPAFGLVTNNANTQITMTEQVRMDLNAVNALVNTSHIYSGDSGGDNWRIMEAGETGDCEDFALTKAKMLLDLGYPASAIHIEAAMIDGSAIPNIGHAWLVVQTTTGDYALDTSSNSIIRNSSLRSNIGTEYICRRRQIGSNWAFIDKFGWLMSSVNLSMTDKALAYSCWYIYDPLLNIFYLVPDAFTLRPFYYYNSINFSEDNNSIYVLKNGANYVYEYKLDENKFTLITQTAISSQYGYVQRDGTLTVPGSNTDFRFSEVVSITGAYDFKHYNNTLAHTPVRTVWWTPFPPSDHNTGLDGVTYTFYEKYDYGTMDTNPDSYGYSLRVVSMLGHGEERGLEGLGESTTTEQFWTYYHHRGVLTRTIGDAFYYRSEHTSVQTISAQGQSSTSTSDLLYYHPTIGDDIILSSSSDQLYAAPLSFFDDDNNLIQGFTLMRDTDVGDNSKYMYKDGSSILSAVLSTVGTTEANLLGFVYIPSTDRLN